MPDQSGDHNGSKRLSGPESDFVWRWKHLVERAGGQTRVANRLNWATSTVSRDCKGDTLPTDDRLTQLCRFLNVPHNEMVDLAGLLSKARVARKTRLKAGSSQSAQAADQPAGTTASRRFTLRKPGWGLVTGAAVAVVAIIVVVAWSLSASSPGSPPVSLKPSGGPYPGLKLMAIPIPIASLTGSLASTFRQSPLAGHGTVTGFEFRNSGETSLCLGAKTTGSRAGENHDPVRVWTCSQAPNEIWIPEQWEIHGTRFTWLVNYKYQSKCLNASNIGGLAKNHLVQLWDCYTSSNEEWDFGDWHKNLSAGASSYPIYVESSNLCLDADKFDLRDGTTVHIWDQYPTSTQFWS